MFGQLGKEMQNTIKGIQHVKAQLFDLLKTDLFKIKQFTVIKVFFFSINLTIVKSMYVTA